MTADLRSPLALLGADEAAPHAALLNPDVRSGVSFTYGGGGSLLTDKWPPFQLVWFYTVDVEKRVQFAQGIAAYEGSTPLSTNTVRYRGTYSVTLSGTIPELEYRTVWGLQSLAAIQELNDQLRAAPGGPPAWINLISHRRVMRAELMGCTSQSAPLVSSGAGAPPGP